MNQDDLRDHVLMRKGAFGPTIMLVSCCVVGVLALCVPKAKEFVFLGWWWYGLIIILAVLNAVLLGFERRTRIRAEDFKNRDTDRIVKNFVPFVVLDACSHVLFSVVVGSTVVQLVVDDQASLMAVVFQCFVVMMILGSAVKTMMTDFLCVMALQREL